MQRAGQRAVEHVFDQRALAAAADAGDRGKAAERDAGRRRCAGCCAARRRSPASRQEAGQRRRRGECCGCRRCGCLCRGGLLVPRLFARVLRSISPPNSEFADSDGIRRFVGTGIAFLPERYGPVTEPCCLGDLGRRAAGDDLAAAIAGRRAEVEQLIGRFDHFAGRARRSAACCPGREASRARRAGGGCRADAGRSSVRRARRARRTVRCRPGWPGGCAGPRRRRASAPAGRA